MVGYVSATGLLWQGAGDHCRGILVLLSKKFAKEDSFHHGGGFHAFGLHGVCDLFVHSTTAYAYKEAYKEAYKDTKDSHPDSWMFIVQTVTRDSRSGMFIVQTEALVETLCRDTDVWIFAQDEGNILSKNRADEIRSERQREQTNPGPTTSIQQLLSQTVVLPSFLRPVFL